MKLGHLLAGLACVAGPVLAGDHPQEARKLSIKDAGGRQSLSWAVSLPPPMPPMVVPTVAGATLTITGAGGDAASFDLPAPGWVADQQATSFKFKNTAPGGPSPVKTATFKSNRMIKVTARASGITLDEPAQGTVSISLTIGGDVYCSQCTAARRDQTGRFMATRCPAPASCAASTTTTTSTTTPTTLGTTTTTTTLAATCGDGVVQGSEQCDLPDPGQCASIPFPMAIGCAACQCCAVSQCFIGFSPYAVGCCGGACQDVSGAGFVRAGVCIPPSCTQDADCNGYSCDGGTCCGQAGALCGNVDCCAGSGATCNAVTWVDSPICCRAPGASCSMATECCSASCTTGVCD
jgi:hypothetical protein